MDRVETLLHDTLAERADEAPTGPVPLVRSPRRRHRRIVLAAATVIGVITAAGLVALLRTPPSTRPPGGPSRPTTGSPALPVIPNGLRVASYGSASLLVPAVLATRTSLCGGPIADEVVAEDGRARLCPGVSNSLAARPGTVVWFRASLATTPYRDISTLPTRFGGEPGRLGYRVTAGGVPAAVLLPTQEIAIVITAPSRRAVDAIVASLRIAPVDPLGCAAQLDRRAVSRPGPSEVMVPSHPVKAVRCEYATEQEPTGRLVGSYLLSSSDAVRLVVALARLGPDPCNCLHSGTPSPGHVELLYFRYRDGPAQRVTGAVGHGLDSYSNGTRHVADFGGSIGKLLSDLTDQH